MRISDWSSDVCSSDLKRIHDRCKHAHIVGACAVKSLRGGCKSAKDVSAADHHAELMPRLLGSADFTGDAVNRFGINSELTGAHQDFARKFQEDTVEARASHAEVIQVKIKEWREP